MANLLPQGKQYYETSAGVPLVGGKVYTYDAGTSNPRVTFQDASGAQPNANPVILDSRGEAVIFWSGTYKVILKDSLDNTIWTVDNIASSDSSFALSLASQVSGSDGSRLVGYRRTDAGSVGRTEFQKLSEIRSVMDFGAVADSVTDNTAALITMGNAIGGIFFIPEGVVFDRSTMITSLDTDVVFFDLSRLNSYTAAGETSKRVGIISSDTSTNDTAWTIDSGHHPGITGNNHGTSGTSSATARVFSIDWASGLHRNQGLTKRGDRYGAYQNFAQESASEWHWRIGSIAPWAAIAASYEFWITAETISGAGVYRSNANHHYVSTGAGTTGSTPPTHTSGTVSDGGVSWTYVDDYDRNVFTVTQNSRVLIGPSGSFSTANWNYVGSPNDPVWQGQVNSNWQAAGLNGNVLLFLTPTDGAGAVQLQPFLKAQAGVGIRCFNAAQTIELYRLSNTEAFTFRSGFAHSLNTITYSASMTPDMNLGNSHIITVTSAAAMTLNNPTNRVTGRRLKVTFRNTSGGAMGVVSFGGLYKLSAWTNPATGFSRSIEFEDDGSNFVEINRTPSDVPN